MHYMYVKCVTVFMIKATEFCQMLFFVSIDVMMYFLVFINSVYYIDLLPDV